MKPIKKQYYVAGTADAPYASHDYLHREKKSYFDNFYYGLNLKFSHDVLRTELAKYGAKVAKSKRSACINVIWSDPSLYSFFVLKHSNST